MYYTFLYKQIRNTYKQHHLVLNCLNINVSYDIRSPSQFNIYEIMIKKVSISKALTVFLYTLCHFTIIYIMIMKRLVQNVNLFQCRIKKDFFLPRLLVIFIGKIHMGLSHPASWTFFLS